MAVSTAPAKRFKSFTDEPIPEEEVIPVLPLGFDLHGEDFDVYPEVQGAVLLEFVGNSDQGAAAMLTFLEAVMEPADWVRLDALLHHKTKITKIEKIKAIVSYLVEEYTARPTKAS